MIGESRPSTGPPKDGGGSAAPQSRPQPSLAPRQWQIARAFEFVAVVVGMGAVFWEFGIERQRDRELRDVRLHATVAELAGHENIAATSPAVQKILGLMHRDGVDMTGISVPNVIFRTAVFEDVDWSDSQMEAVAFTCTQLVLQILRSPEVRNKAHRLTCARLTNARFHGANLQAARFHRADLSRAEFFHAQLSGMTAEETDFSHARFVDESSRKYPLPSIVRFLVPAVLFNCYKPAPGRADCVRLSLVVFFRAHMPGAHFTGAEIADADFTRATLRDARFRCEASAQGDATKPRCTTINYACFQGADLTDASFEGVTIENANFTGAVLSGARFNDVTFSRVVFPKEQIEAANFDRNSHESLEEARVELAAFPVEQARPCDPTWRSRLAPWTDRPGDPTVSDRHPLFRHRG